jgi:hypothetical protein
MKQTPTVLSLPKQEKGESDEKYYRRVRNWLNGEDVRTKVDLRDWTGSPPFHLNREES